MLKIRLETINRLKNSLKDLLQCLSAFNNKFNSSWCKKNIRVWNLKSGIVLGYYEKY